MGSADFGVAVTYYNSDLAGMPPSDRDGMPGSEWQALRMSRKHLFQSVLLRSYSRKNAVERANGIWL
jgi:hypothetical protein